MERGQDSFTNKSSISLRTGDFDLPQPTSNKIESTNIRFKILLCCIFTLTIYFQQLFSFSHSIYYIFERALRWDRTDMGILLASQLWGAAIGFYISSKYITKYESKWIIIFANLWLSYFNLFSYFSSFAGFYETWINRVFFAVGEGVILTTVYRTLINWTPKKQWIGTLFCVWSSLGIGYTLSQYTSAFFVGPYYYYVGIAFNAILPILVAVVWWLPTTQISPHLHPTISRREIDSIKLSSFPEHKKITPPKFLIWDTRRVILSGFLFGISFVPWFHFNPSYYFDLVTLKVELNELPAVASLPFAIWALFSFIVYAIPRFQQINDKKLLQLFIVIITLTCSSIVLFTVQDYASLSISNIKICIVTLCNCISFILYLSSILEPSTYSPEALLGYSMCSFSIGGALGLIFAGYVVEMSGTWSVICKFSAFANIFNIFVIVIPTLLKTLIQL